MFNFLSKRKCKTREEILKHKLDIKGRVQKGNREKEKKYWN